MRGSHHGLMIRNGSFYIISVTFHIVVYFILITSTVICKCRSCQCLWFLLTNKLNYSLSGRLLEDESFITVEYFKGLAASNPLDICV